MAERKTVHFICTVNVCRSPIAEGLFRHLVKDRDDIEVISAGVGASHGQPASLHTMEVLRPWAIDLSKFRSQPLSDELVEKADFILAMTRSHLDTIMCIYHEAADKTFLVCEFAE